MQSRTIPRVVREAASLFGDATAVEDGDVHLTFRQLAEAGVAATRAFLAAGIEPGDRVAIWAPNAHEWIVAAIGLQGAGGVLVPLNTRLKRTEAGYILEKSAARLLCTVTDFLGVDYVAEVAQIRSELPALEGVIALRGSSPNATPWKEFLARGSSVPEEKARARAEAVSPDDLSDILFTSGTTGNPKGVMTAHGQNVEAFLVWSELVGLRAGDRYLIVNPFFHSFGYKAGWLSCILRGATALPHPVFDVAQVLTRIGRERVSAMPGPPTLYQSLLAHPDRSRYDLSNLRLAVTGAAPVPVPLIERMRSELGFETILTAYGLTETCGVVTMCREGDDAETISKTSGRAIPGVEVRCIDESGKDVPRGTPGEIIVRGYNVMRGYFEDPDETAKTIDAEGFLHTGDIGVMDERGYIQITDRIKDMFIMGGFNCYPAEIEGLMFGSGLFAQVAVIGVPDERMGEVGMAFVVPAPGRDVTPASVTTWCRENMANYKVPRHVEVVSELPVTASGKVTKFKLRERAEGLLARS
ncbi:MAG: fatty acid--CoA ligase family protein [Deltaproteobacteria bacterium]|nr:fatty acid--CoA ligase family protein [Deltaproteobacteria bacterium]